MGVEDVFALVDDPGDLFDMRDGDFTGGEGVGEGFAVSGHPRSGDEACGSGSSQGDPVGDPRCGTRRSVGGMVAGTVPDRDRAHEFRVECLDGFAECQHPR